MSRFVTKIKVPVEDVVKALPNGTFLERVNYDPALGCVELYWDNDQFITPFTTATEFTIEQLANKKLPAQTRVRENGARTITVKEALIADVVVPMAGQRPQRRRAVR